MRYELPYIGTAKLMVGVKKNSKEKIQYCITAINGKKIICQDIPKPLNITNNKIITQEIIKFIRPLVTTEIGNISLGKYTFLIKFPF